MAGCITLHHKLRKRQIQKRLMESGTKFLLAFVFSASSATLALPPGPSQSSQHILGAASEVQPSVGSAQLIGHLYDPWSFIGSEHGETLETSKAKPRKLKQVISGPSPNLIFTLNHI